MKYITLISILFLLCSINAQEVFKAENGKYGISQFGGADDSIMFPAEYKKIIIYSGYFYVGLKDDKLYPLISNGEVNKETYDEFEEIPYFEDVIFGYRDGLIDIISLTDHHFRMKGVKGDRASNDMKDSQRENLYMVTIESDEGFGLVNMELGKQIFQTIYEELEISNDYLIVTTKEEKKGVYHLDGTIVFAPQSIEFSSFDVIGFGEKKFLLYGKKGTVGYYGAINNYYVPTIYSDVECMDTNCELVLVYSKKGDGLYYKGKQILDCKYDSVMNSSQAGYIAEVDKDGQVFFVKSDGELVPESVIYPEIKE